MLAPLLLALCLGGGLAAFLASPAHAQGAVPTVRILADQDRVVAGEEATFTLTRTGGTSAELTVQVDSIQYNAGRYDATLLGHKVTFQVGSATAVLTVATIDDGIPEIRDWVAAAVVPGSGYAKGDPGRATVTVEDPPIPIISIAADQDPVAEGEAATFTLTRTGNTSNALTVRVNVADPGAFRRGNHWHPVPSPQVTARFAAGSDTAAISLPTRDDWRDIPDNDLTVSVTPGDNYAPGDAASAKVTVTDNDVAPEIEILIDPARAVEGETLTFTLRRHGNSENQVNVALDIGLQGQPHTIRLLLSPDQTETTVPIVTNDNDLDEADRTYVATILPYPSEADADAEPEYWTVRGRRTASATVADDDLPIVGIEAVHDSRREGDLVRFRLFREGDASGELSVTTLFSQDTNVTTDLGNYRVSNRFGAGVTELILTYGTVRDDGDEPDGKFSAEIVTKNHYSIDPSRVSASTRIIDGDPTPTLVAEDVRASEDGGVMVFRLELAGGLTSGRTVRGEVFTQDGTATVADRDYDRAEGTFSIPPGETAFIVSVPVNDDDMAEYDETFTLLVRNITNATLLDDVDYVEVTGTIEDDEPVVSLSARSYAVPEGEPVVFNLTRTGDATGELTVTLLVLERLDDGSLETGHQTVTFLPNSSEAEWSVATEDDDVDEPDGWVGAAIPDPVYLDLPAVYRPVQSSVISVTILDNDLPMVTIEAAHSERTEGEDVEFTLTRQGVLSVPLTVNVTVTGGDDYLTDEQPATAIFAEGTSSVTLSLPTEDDDPVQDRDTVTATVAAGDGYQAGEPATASVNLFDTERIYPSVSIRANRPVVNEGETVVFTLTRTGPYLNESLTVPVQVAETRWKSGEEEGLGWDPFARSNYTRSIFSDHEVIFEPGSTTATVVHPTVDETQNDGNSRVRATILLGAYALRPGPWRVEAWVRDDDIPTVTVTSAATRKFEDDPGTSIMFVDGEAVHPEVVQTGFEEIVEDDAKLLGIVLSRTGETSHTLSIRTDGYGLAWGPGFVTAEWGDILVDGERYASYYYGDLVIPEDDEASLVDPYRDPVRPHWHIFDGRSSFFWSRWPHRVGPLGGFSYHFIEPFYCESVPGDCGYEPQYLVGPSTIAKWRVFNNAQGVRVEAGQASVSEGEDVTFTLHRYGGTRDDQLHALTVKVQVTQNGEFIRGVPPQTVTFAESPDTINQSARDGELSKTVTISTADDLLDEADGDITLTIIPLTEEELAGTLRRYELEEAGGDSTWSYQATVRVLDDDELGFTISDAEADEAVGSIEFTVTLPGPSALETSVDWATAPGYNAVAGKDYEAGGGTLTFAPGETSKTIAVILLDDDVFELDETFLVQLSNPLGGSLSVPTGTGTITDDDTWQVVSLHPDSEGVVEGQDVVFRLERCTYVDPQTCTQVEPRGRLEVLPSLIWSPGVLPEDTSGLLVAFEAGSWTTTVTLPTVDDDLFQPTGLVILNFGSIPGDPESDRVSGTVDVWDNDIPVSIVEEVQASEGDREITFAVSLQEPAILPVTVDVATVDGTATSFDFASSSRDYEAKSETLTFGEGEQTKQFTVTLVDDRLDEAREEFTVELSNPVNGRISNGAATGVIEDNDDYLKARLIPPALTLIPEDSEDPALFRVELSHEDTALSKRSVAVDWTVTPGTAAHGEDYVEAGGSVTIPAGQTSASFQVHLVDDSLFEAEFETFTVTLTGGQGVEIDEAQNSATIRIRDTDSVGVALFADAENVVEGEEATFTVHLVGAATTAPVEIEYETAGEAKAGEDYTAPGGTLTIPEGQRFGIITIATLPDNVPDPDETLEVNLTEVTSLERPLDQKQGSASVTILDEGGNAVSLGPMPGEGPVTPNEGTVVPAEATEGQPMQFTVTLFLPANVPANVNWETRGYEGDPSPDGAATAGTDYKTSSGKATIPAGATSATFTVVTNDDSVAEKSEVFQVALTEATLGADSDTAPDLPLGVFSVVGRILDNDDSPDTALLGVEPKAVAEDAGATELTVLASLPHGNTLPADAEVAVAVAGDGATEGDDYTATQVMLTIPAGQTSGSGTLTLTPMDDLLAEGDETVQLTGTAAGLNVIPVPLTITDNDALPAGVTLTVAPDTVDEEAGPTGLDVTAAFTDGAPSGADTEVVLSVAGASLTFEEEIPDGHSGTTTTTRTTEAASANDFTADSVTVTIPAGEMQGTATLTLTPTDDTVAEGDETVQVSGDAGGLAVTAAGVTIIDNDTEPTGIELSVTPGRVDEDAGDMDLQVTATLTGGGSRTEDAPITLSVHGVTATAGDDYTAAPDVTLTIPAGSTTGTATLTLTLINDDLHEGEEQLAVRGSNAVPGLPVTGLRIAIADDDAAPTGITLSLDTNRVPEDAGLQELSVTATLEGGSKRTVDTQVMLSASNLTTSDADYLALPAVLTIDSGQPQGTATMLLVPADDSIDEDDETLEVRGATAELNLPVSSRQVTITDDDSAGVSISPTALTVPEGGSGSYTVALDSQPTGEVTVTISGHDGTDITLSETTLTFTAANWDVAQTVTVSASQDEDAAPDQAVTLSHAVTGTGEYQGVTADSVMVTIEEKDTVGVSIAPTSLTVDEGSSASYTVALDSQPSGEVAVTVSGHAGTDLSVSPAALTFTSENWETPQTVTVTAGEDNDAAQDQEVTLSHAVSSADDAEYNNLTADSVTVTITEADTAGVSIGPTALTVLEGGSGSYTVVLTTRPSADVTIVISGHADTDITLSNDLLTFTAANWDVAQTVTVNAAQDEDAAADDDVTLRHTVSSVQDADYNGLTADDVEVTITETDSAGMTIDSASLTVVEGNSDSYTVVLDTRPSGEVTVTIGGHDGTDVSVDRSTLTFTSENWDTPQTVTVTAGQDEDAAPDQAVTLSHTVSGTGEYASVTADSVTVTITEVDTAGVSIAPTSLTVQEDGSGAYTVVLDSQPTADVKVDISGQAGTDITLSDIALTFTSANWETPQTVTVNAARDDDATTDAAVTLSHTVTGTGEYASLTVDSVTVTITETDFPRVTVDPHSLEIVEGSSGSYTVVLTTRPNADVTIAISGQAGTDVSVSGETLTNDVLTFTTENWNVAQAVTVTAGDDDDAAADSVTLKHSVEGGDYQGIVAWPVSVKITDDDTAGVSINPTELTVPEGSSGAYTVLLDTQPTAEVTVTISGHEGTDLTLSGGTLTNNTLTFTAANWNVAQTVIVTAGEDADAVADDAVTLSHAVAGVGEYDNLTADNVTVTIDEADTAGVSIDPTTLTVPEGNSNTYTVVLTTQPTGDVTVTISGHAGTDVTLSNDSLTFTAANWNQAQTVTVNAAPDADAVADQAVTLSHDVNGTGEYETVTAETVTVTITEDDTAGVSIAPTSLTVVEGNSDSYTVVLDTQPTGEVTVTIGGHDGTDIMLSDTTLTFTAANWNVAQTVTVTATQDVDAVVDQTATLSHAVTSVDDTLYNSIAADSVVVTITEDDTAGVSISPTSLTVVEGNSDSYTVVLDSQPTVEVTVIISGHNGTDVSVGPSTLTFTAADWNVAQTVTVSASRDDDAAPDQAVTLSHAVGGAGEYASVTADNVTITITEDDTAGVTINPTTLTVVEGGSDSYTVVLDSQPTAEVTVIVSGHAGTDVTLSNDSLTFTAANWDIAQTVTVNAASDADAAADSAVTLAHAVSGTGEYETVTAESVTVTITETDTSTLSVSPARAAEDAGHVVFEVAISAASDQAVTVDYATSDGTAKAGQDYTETRGALTFSANSVASQTVIVPVLDDTMDEAEEETFTLTLSQAVAAVLAGGGETLTVTGTITDNDDPEVTASFGQSIYTVAEGTTVEVTVSLSGDPEREVTIPLDKTENGASSEDYSGVPGSLSFAPGETSKSFIFTANDDRIDDDGESVVLGFGTLPDGVSAGGVAPGATVTITDDDTAGVSINPTALTVTEGDAEGAKYTVVLDAQPTRDVTVTISGHAGTDVSVDKTTLTFTAADWDAAQTVTVNAAEDADALADDSISLSHAVSSVDDEDYNNITAESVTITIDEVDTAGVSIDPTALTVPEGSSANYTVVLDTQPSAGVTVTVGGHSGTDVSVDQSTLTFTPDNWDVAQTVKVSAAADNDATADEAVTLGHAVTGTGEYASVTTDSVTVTITEADTAGVSINPTALTVAEDGSGAYTVVLTTRPSADVTVTVIGHAGTDITVSDTTLIFTADNWNAPQTVTVNAARDEDAAADDAVILSHAVGGAQEYQGVTTASVVVTITEDDSATDNEDDNAGVTISFEKSFNIMIEGHAAGLNIILSAPLETELRIPLEVLPESTAGAEDYTLIDTGETLNEGQYPGFMSDPGLVLSPGETVGYVIVNSTVDLEDEGDEHLLLTFGPLPDGITPGSITQFTSTIEDAWRVSFDALSYEATEGGPGVEVTVLLDRPFEVGLTVPLTAVFGNGADASDWSGVPDEVVVGAGDTSKSFTVAAVDDTVDDDGEMVELSFGTLPAGLVAATPATATLTIGDDDTAGVSIEPTELPVTEGGSGTYTVVLDSQPTADVTVAISGHDGTAIAPSHIALTFTPSNWNIAQTVTLTAGDVDTTTEVTLSHQVSASGEYGTVTADDVVVTVLAIAEENQDPDQVEVTVSFADESYDVREGTDNVNVGLVLSPAPDSAVDIPIIVSSQSTAGDEDYSGVPTTVTFAQDQTSGSFQVQPLVDLEDENDEQVVLVFGTLPEGIGAGDFDQTTVTILDAVRVSFDASSYEATEGGADAVVTVQLNEPAPYEMTVPLTAEGRNGADDSDWSGVPGSVVFNTGDTSKTFTVIAVDDTVEDDDEMVELGFGTLPGGLIAEDPATATLTIMNQENGQPTGDSCGGAIWCATLTFGETDRAVLTHENGMIRSFDWGGRWDHRGRSEGATITSNKFTYEDTEYTIAVISTSGTVPFPQLSKFFLGFDQYKSVPDEETYSQWTLYVGDAAFPFSEERLIPPHWFRWRHPGAYFIEPGATVELRIEANVELEKESRPPARYLTVVPETFDGANMALELLWEWPSFDGAEDVVFKDLDDHTGYRTEWKKAGDEWDESESNSLERSDWDQTMGMSTWLSHILDLDEGVEYAVRLIAVYGDVESEPTDEVIVKARETIPPEISSAVVDGAMLTLTYDEALDEGSEPATNAFTAKVGGKDRDILAVSVNGRAVTFTLASAVTAEDTVTLNYIDKLEVFVSQLQTMEINRAKNFSLDGEDNHTAEFVRDAEGNYAPAFLDLSVTNNTPGTDNAQVRETAENPPAAPKNLTATVNADGSVTLTWEAPDDDSITEYRVSRRQTDEDEGTSLTKVTDTGRTADTYTDTATAAGVSYTYFVQAINEVGLSDESNYALIALPQPPEAGQNTQPTGAPGIDGTVRVGETLTADTSGIHDADEMTNVAFSYQWLRSDGGSDSNIQDATGSSYTLTEEDEGRTIKVTVSFTDSEGNPETLTSDPTGEVEAKPNTEATGAPTIDGMARVSQTLTADTSGIDDDDGLDNAVFSYQWVRNDGGVDTIIQDATGDAYTLTEDDEDRTVRVQVSFTDDAGNQETLTSKATGEVVANAGPLIGFTLVDTSGPYQDVLWEHWGDDSTLTLDYPASGSYGIRVDTESGEEIGSVRLQLSGKKKVDRTEGAAPYSLYGDEGENALNGESLPVGDYTLTATAYSEGGEVLGRLQVSFTVAASEEPPPGRPKDLVGEASENGIELTWSAPSGSAVTQYVIYRAELEDGQLHGRPMTRYATIDATGADMAYTDTGVEAGQEYRYRVAAVNSAGEGRKSNWLDLKAEEPSS